MRWARNAKVPIISSWGETQLGITIDYWVPGAHMLKDKKWTVQLRWGRNVWRNRRDLVLYKTSEVFLYNAWRRTTAAKTILFVLPCTVSPLLGNSHILLMSPAKWRDSRAEVHPLCCVLLKRYLPTFIHGSAGPVYYLCVRFACTFPPNSSALHTDLYVNIFLNCSGSSHDFWQLHGKEGSS